MNPDRVRINIDRQGIAQVVLSRPDKMNALDPAMFSAILDAIARLRSEPNLRAVVLYGEGRAFCAGLDKATLASTAAGHSGLGDLAPRTHGLANRWQQVAWGWREVPAPVIAAVHGAAFGGGLQIALGADMRYVHHDAQLSMMEIKWGLVPDMAGFVLLSELARADVVRELVLTGRIVRGEEAVSLGLATRATANPLADSLEMAQQIASSSPDAIRAAKRLLNSASPVAAGPVLQMESFEQQRLIGGCNQQEAVRAGLDGGREPT